ncbi:hypothetical protein H4R19_003196, partial [Coemansia spiralis]
VRLRNLSENGTLVNAEAMAAGQQRALRTGDVITVVGRSLRFEAPHTADAAAAAAVSTPEAGRVAGLPLRVVQSDRVERRVARPPMRRETISMMGRLRVRNPETAIKLKRWDQHYGAAGDSQPSANELSDILDESPPPGLLDSSNDSRTLGGAGDDPFASSGTDSGAFQRMAASVRNWNRERPLVPADAPPPPLRLSALLDAAGAVAVEARAHTPLASKKRAATTEVTSASKRARVPGFCRSQSLPRGLGMSPVQSAAQGPRPSLNPSAAGTSTYGSEEETSRGTIGMNPLSQFNRSPTLQRQQQQQQQPGSAGRALQRCDSVRSPTQLPRGSALSSQREAGLGTGIQPPTSLRRPFGSPLRRTTSSNRSFIRAPTELARLRLPRPPQTTPAAVAAGDSSDEVATEPEPSSDSDDDDDGIIATEQPTVTAAAAVTTPCLRRILLTGTSSTVRKSVRFGPPLSPEVFDAQAPPSTPLRRGTPMQMARVSSILRRGADLAHHPPTPHPARAAGPETLVVADPSLLQSLLQPRPSARRAIKQQVARLAALAEGCATSEELRPFLDNETPDDGPRSTKKLPSLLVDDIFDMDGASSDPCGAAMAPTPLPLPVQGLGAAEPAPIPMPLLAHVAVTAAAQTVAEDAPQQTVTARPLGSTSSDEYLTDDESGRAQRVGAAEKIEDIASPTRRDSPADRRRRSIRLARADRRNTLDAATRTRRDSADCSADTSPLVVRRAPPAVTAAGGAQPRSSVHRSQDRRDRRRTEPVDLPSLRGSESPDSLDDIGASIAAMAAALGEDVPAMFGTRKDPALEPAQEPSPEVEEEDEGEEEPQPPSPEPQPAEPLLGLAEAMHMSAGEVPQPVDGETDGIQTPVCDAAPSGSELLLAEQAELQSRLCSSAETTMVWPDPGDGQQPEPSEPSGTPLRGAKRKRELALRRRTTGLEDLGPSSSRGADSDDDNNNDDDNEACSTDELLARRERLRRQQERRRRRQTVAELKRRRSSWRGWVPSNNTSSPLRPLTSSPPPSPPQSPSLQPHAGQRLRTDAIEESSHVVGSADRGAVAGHVGSSVAKASEAARDAESPPLSSLASLTLHPPPLSAAMYPPPSWSRAAGSSSGTGTGSVFERSEPQTSSDGDRTLPKRRRLVDYVANALGIGSAGAPAQQSADESGSKHAYPPRPTPIDLGWEHVAAGFTPSDSNIGNSAVLEQPPPQSSTETLETRLDAGGPTDEGDATPMVQPSQQPVELFARSQSADASEAETQPNAEEAMEPTDPEPSAPRDAPGEPAGEQEEPVAAALSPVQTRGRAARRQQEPAVASEPAAPTQPDIAQDTVVVSGHALRKQSVADLPPKCEPPTDENAAEAVPSPVHTRSRGRKHGAAAKPEAPAAAPPVKRGHGRAPKSTAAASSKRVSALPTSPPATRSSKRSKRR